MVAAPNNASNYYYHYLEREKNFTFPYLSPVAQLFIYLAKAEIGHCQRQMDFNFETERIRSAGSSREWQQP